MGKQVQLYFSPEDVAEFCDTMVSDFDAVLLPHRLRSQVVEPVGSITQDTDSGSRSLGYLVRREDIKQVRLREIPAQGCWAVDEVRSPVVELDGGFYDNDKILRGRLYFTAGFYDKGKVYVEKPVSFVEWANHVLAAGKRHGERNKVLGATVGAHAQVLRSKGCELRAP